MEMKYSIGQKVCVVKKINQWVHCGTSCGWDDGMDVTIGKVYKIIAITDKQNVLPCSGYRLNTGDDTIDFYTDKWDSFYPLESLELYNEVGKQLLLWNDVDETD